MMSTRAELSSLRQRNRAAEAERERLREEMAANGERIAVLEARLRDSVLHEPSAALRAAAWRAAKVPSSPLYRLLRAC